MKTTVEFPCDHFVSHSIFFSPKQVIFIYFSKDREREEQENQLREELRQEWAAKQNQLKEEEIDITFSYWDGSGHRKVLRMKKGK